MMKQDEEPSGVAAPVDRIVRGGELELAMNEKSELKLFICGESGNTDEWTHGGGRTLVVAKTAEEANQMSDHSCAEEVVIGTESQVLMWDDIGDVR